MARVIPPAAPLLILTWVGTLAHQFGGIAWAGTVAGLALAAFLLVELPRASRAARLLFAGMTGAGLVALAFTPDPLGTLFESWRRGASYVAFFLALSVLRDAAERSPLVRRCGRHLVAQPPGRRYAALAAGGHVYSIILSYGAIDLFGAMVTRANTLAAAGGSSEVQRIRLKRMMLAVYRGFAAMNCWSPLNIMTAVVSSAVPGARFGLLIPLAFGVAVVILAAGWAVDRASAARLATRGGTRPATEERWSIHMRIVALVLCVFAAAEIVGHVFHTSLVMGVTAAVPAFGIVWMVVQAARYGWLAALGTLPRRLRLFLRRLPSFRGEATVLGCGGFLAGALAASLPVLGASDLLTAAALPPLLVLFAIPTLVLVTGQLGLNPIVLIGAVGAAIPDPQAMGIAPSVLAFACMLGWGIGANSTPMSASAITTARWAGASPWTIATIWNGPLTLIALAIVWVALLVAHLLMPA